jgi:DNA-binding transcriptional ArsR family regulator
MKRDVFQAIFDPNRKAIFSLPTNQKLTLIRITKKFGTSQPAISRHIKILAECGLVVTTQQGRKRYCEFRLAKLNEISDWVYKSRELWENNLDVQINYLIENQSQENRNARRKKYFRRES